jgi:protein-S-isoprenylcysteine O-methyltransferase Ste14
MTEQGYAVAALIVVCGSYLRVITVLSGAIRTWQNRGRFVKFQMGVVEALNTPEPLVLAAITTLLVVRSLDWSDVSIGELVAASFGAALVLAGWAFTLWSFRSWPSIFSGHAVVDNQQLVTTGAYGAVRHPVYVGVLLLWFGLGVAFVSPVALLIAALYVTPVYVLYARSEERMMVEAFGDTYLQYCRMVPAFIPQLRRRATKTR